MPLPVLPSRGPRVFVLDDQPTIADSIAAILKMSGYEAHARYASDAILELATELSPDLLIADVTLDPNSINGIDLAIYFERFYPECRVILISGNPDNFELQNYARLAGHHFPLLSKPVPPQQVLDAVERSLAQFTRAA